MFDSTKTQAQQISVLQGRIASLEHRVGLLQAQTKDALVDEISLLREQTGEALALIPGTASNVDVQNAIRLVAKGEQE